MTRASAPASDSVDSALWTERRTRPWVGATAALLCSALAVAVTWLLRQRGIDTVAVSLFGVLGASAVGGLYAGLVTTLLQTVVLGALFIAVAQDGSSVAPGDWIRLVLFAVLGTISAMLVHVAVRQRVQAHQRLTALREAQQLSNIVLEGVADGVIVLDGGLRYRVWNRAMEVLTGVSASDVLGRQINEVFPSVERLGVLSLLERGLAGETVVSDDIPFHARGKAPAWLLVRFAPLRDLSEKVVGVVGTLHDITDRKRAELAIARSESRYRGLMEQASDGILLISAADGRIVEANQRAEEMLGYGTDELIGYTAEGLADPGQIPRHATRWNELSEGRTVLAQRPLRRKDGTCFPAEISQKILADGLLQEIIRDISDRTQLEEDLRQSQKMEAVGKLAGGVAHDFNNLLTTVLGNVELALVELPQGSHLHDDLREVKKAAERAAGLVRQLLAFSGKQFFLLQRLDLNSVVRESQELLERTVGADVIVTIALAPDLWPVRADRSQLQQMLISLVVNAKDAMPTGGNLSIETRNAAAYAAPPQLTRNDYVELLVADTGIGMTAKIAERAFDPFFTTKGGGQGVGLGLSAVHGIVKQSGGEVTVETSPGGGASFRILLPRDDAEHPQASSALWEGSRAPVSASGAPASAAQNRRRASDLTTETS